jgi:hypothetical protein
VNVPYGWSPPFSASGTQNKDRSLQHSERSFRRVKCWLAGQEKKITELMIAPS